MIIHVAHPSQVSYARRTAAEAAKAEGFDEADAGRVALVATEMASNLLKHAEQGVIVVGPYADATGAGIELLSLDKGAGIRDVSNALRDGVSSAGTLGGGLGAMQRQSEDFALFSRPEMGVAIVARIARVGVASRARDVTLGAVVVPIAGEAACGDAWSYADAEAGPTLFLADGSGHGVNAEAAARTAVRAFRENAEDSCGRIAEFVHTALRPTRGAAIAVARVDRAERVVRFVGIGNICGAVVAGTVTKRMVSHGGIAGHVAPRVREFVYPYEGTPIVILHSDGLSAKWELSDYPGLAASHPSLIAGVLYRDFHRPRDDASIVVLRG